MTDELDLAAAVGFVEPELRAEFPGLRLAWVTVECRPGPSPAAVQQRLAALSNRYRGASVVAMRTQPIPQAYRSFFRHVGLDPDTDRIPSEEAAVQRLLHGQFRSHSLVDDALLIAIVETGVAVGALDAGLVDESGLGVRVSAAGDVLGEGERAHQLPRGRLVIADGRTVHAELFGATAPGHGVSPRTTRIALFAIGVDGVPAIHLEEALWVCLEVLNAA